MVKSERQAYILHLVNLHKKVILTELCEQIKVSKDTLRRDLVALDVQGKIKKIHGGAVVPFQNGHDQIQQGLAYIQKKIIAKKAISLITTGMFILSGGGSTIMELAKELPPDLKATFVSGSIPALYEYSKHPNLEVIAIGDKISKKSKITIGSEAISRIQRIRANACFLGINAINLEAGISDADWDIVQVKKAMIESAEKLVCLTISEKIDSRQPIQVCDIKNIDVLVTELSPDDPKLQPYVNAGITVI